MAKELENKYKGQNNEKVVDSDQYFKYDEKFIAKYEVLQFVGLKLQGIKIVSDFLNHYEELLTD